MSAPELDKNGTPNDGLEQHIRAEVNGREYRMVVCADCNCIIRKAYDVDRCYMCGDFVCGNCTHVHAQSSCRKLRKARREGAAQVRGR